jgi:hypothetical protein
MTEERHRGHLPGEGCDTLKVRLWDEDVKGRKDELFEWEGAMDWGWISKNGTDGCGSGEGKIITRDTQIPLDNT